MKKFCGVYVEFGDGYHDPMYCQREYGHEGLHVWSDVDAVSRYDGSPGGQMVLMWEQDPTWPDGREPRFDA